MFAVKGRRAAVGVLLGTLTSAVVVAGCGTDSAEPTVATTTSTTVTSSTSTTVVVTTEPAAENPPPEPTGEDLQQLEEEIRADVIAGHLAYWEFLTTGDVTLVQSFVDAALYEAYLVNVVPDLEENGLFREGFVLEIDVPSVGLSDDLSAALVRYCYVSDQDLVQVDDTGEESPGQSAGEPFAVIKTVELAEDGVWKTTFGTSRGLYGREFEETCAKYLNG